MVWVTCPKCNGNDMWRKCPTCNGTCSIGRDQYGNDIPCKFCTGGEVIDVCSDCNGVGQVHVPD